MELNFDKEMDALLRQAARQEMPLPATEVHLDVDELAAFSANALPVKARARAMEHLVDCGNCRTILSNLVFFEQQDEEKSAGAFAAAAPVVKGSSLVERILGVFKFPALAYGMAGLVLLFATAIGLMVFRGNSGGADVARLSKQEAPAAAREAAEPYPYLSEAASQANSNTAVADTAAIASAANNAVGGVFSIPPQNVPGGYASNSSSNMAPALRKDDAGPALLDEQPKVKSAPITIDGVSTEAAPPPPAPAPASVDRVNREEDNLRLAKPQQQITDQVTRSQDNFRNSTNNTQILTPDGSDKDRRLRAVTGEAGAGMPREAARDDKEKQTPDATKNAAPAKTESKKAGKRNKKNAAAAAEAAASPAPTPAKTPEPKKPDEEKHEEEHPPCR